MFSGAHSLSIETVRAWNNVYRFGKQLRKMLEESDKQARKIAEDAEDAEKAASAQDNIKSYTCDAQNGSLEVKVVSAPNEADAKAADHVLDNELEAHDDTMKRPPKKKTAKAQDSNVATSCKKEAKCACKAEAKAKTKADTVKTDKADQKAAKVEPPKAETKVKSEASEACTKAHKTAKNCGI